MICSNWCPWRCQQTCSLCAWLSITRTHSSTGICLILVTMAAFRSGVVWGLSLYTQFFKYHHRYKSRGLRSVECGAHSTSHLLLIRRSSNRSLSHSRVQLAVCWVAPSCWNHCEARGRVLRHPSALQNSYSTAR